MCCVLFVGVECCSNMMELKVLGLGNELGHRSIVPAEGKICDINSDRPSTLNLKREQTAMFMVSPANAVPIYTSYTAIAPSSSSCDIDRMLDDMSIGEDLAASSESDKSFGGLSRSIRMKRSVSSLKGSNGRGCDINVKTQCIVEARQIEIDFASITSKSFMVRISAPNNETSSLLEFPTYGTTDYFCPKMDGCGHGMWTFEVLQQNGSRLVTVASQAMYLDGVGSLFFTVGDDFEPRLSSQEFLRLPSASRCCGRQRLLEQSI